jgi:hypothetical protein
VPSFRVRLGVMQSCHRALLSTSPASMARQSPRLRALCCRLPWSGVSSFILFLGGNHIGGGQVFLPVSVFSVWSFGIGGSPALKPSPGRVGGGGNSRARAGQAHAHTCTQVHMCNRELPVSGWLSVCTLSCEAATNHLHTPVIPACHGRQCRVFRLQLACPHSCTYL